MPVIRKISAKNANYDEIKAILEQDGCVVISDAIDLPKLYELKQDMEEGFASVPVCQGNFFGFATKRMSSILARSKVSWDLAVNPAVISVMDHFLLKSCREYQLNLTQAIQICPGEPAQMIHSDDLMFPIDLFATDNQKMMNCMWAIDDFTIANGATNLVPGSHLWPRDRQPVPEEIVPGEMSAGSVLIWLGSLLHGGGANKTIKPRTGLVISYSLGWLRQAENHYLALPKELVSQFPERLQKLVGYFVHEPNLGAVNGRNPMETLYGDDSDALRFEEFIPDEVQGILEEHRARAVV